MCSVFLSSLVAALRNTYKEPAAETGEVPVVLWILPAGSGPSREVSDEVHAKLLDRLSAEYSQQENKTYTCLYFKRGLGLPIAFPGSVLLPRSVCLLADSQVCATPGSLGL